MSQKRIVTSSILFLVTCSSTEARFLQADPVGYQDDLDLYTYVQDDPANKTDPSGKESCSKPPCPDIPRAPQSVEDAAVGVTKTMPISEGSRETGAQIMVDKANPSQVTQTRVGPAAGQNDPDNPMKFVFNPIDKSASDKLGADAHPHPLQGSSDAKGLGQKAVQDKINTRNQYPSTGDYHHMDQTNAPMFNKNPTGAITESYRARNVDHTIVIVPGTAPLGPVPGDLHDVVPTP